VAPGPRPVLRVGELPQRVHLNSEFVQHYYHGPTSLQFVRPAVIFDIFSYLCTSSLKYIVVLERGFSFGAGFMRVKLDTNVTRNFARLLAEEGRSHIHLGALERIWKNSLASLTGESFSNATARCENTIAFGGYRRRKYGYF